MKLVFLGKGTFEPQVVKRENVSICEAARKLSV